MKVWGVVGRLHEHPLPSWCMTHDLHALFTISPDMSLISHVTAWYYAQSPVVRFVIGESAKSLLKDCILPTLRGWIGRAWRRRAVPKLRRWRSRLGAALRSSVRSALRAMPRMLPMIQQAGSR